MLGWLALGEVILVEVIQGEVVRVKAGVGLGVEEEEVEFLTGRPS
jgi:hypothetical protein